ncbi:hypothetical protein I3842_02G072400 [Carya illinoinensis]|uniref:Prefoldin subunit 3 n=1 Tax=Carya illinoinensis TaxID=32201 RepID=A0A922FVG6_CARIL|nr:hypothetical protein I3842_02G072400 [Carya illinoinensis]
MALSTPGVPERRVIPGAEFVEDVQTCLNVNSALAFLQERLQQYKLVEMRLLAQQRDIQAKIPGIEKCLDVVAPLQTKKGTGYNGLYVCVLLVSLFYTCNSRITCRIRALITDFEASEGIYYWARIEDNDSATALLQKNLDNAKASLEVVDANLQFLRDQATITQVTITRVYNWDVHRHRIRQAAAGKDS